jgi:hypothetical protein
MVRALAIGLLFAVASLVGCGDSGRLSRGEYQARLDALNQGFIALDEGHGNAMSISSEYYGVLTERYARLEERLATTLEELRPPKDAERANALLARGSRDYAREARAALPGIETLALGEAPRLVDRRTAKATREIQQATEQLHKAGYRF